MVSSSEGLMMALAIVGQSLLLEENPHRQQTFFTTAGGVFQGTTASHERYPTQSREMSSKQPAVDSQIDHAAAIKYWSATEATVSGVLGGFPQVSRIDLQGSSNFLTKLRRKARIPEQQKLGRAVDCGAGIGRITDGLLSKHANVVDIVEPVKNFTDQVKAENVGTIFNIGLEAWYPQEEGSGPYDLIWNQWCLSQITDSQVVEYLKRLVPVLREGGWIIVKENTSDQHAGVDIYDETDSSVTRTNAKLRALFQQADLKVVASEVQRGMPKDLYVVQSYALQP